MWDRRTLKTNAKGVLRKYYWFVFLVCFVVLIVGAESNQPSNYYSRLSTDFDISNPPPLDFEDQAAIEEYLQHLQGRLVLWGIACGIALLVAAYKVFVGNLILVGRCRCLMQARRDNPSLRDLFWAFKDGRYRKVVKTMFLRDLRLFLWSLLLIVPGIVKSYEYYYIPYLLAENPDIETKRVFELTRNMTYGEKGKIFVLGLSFFGWLLLALIPYMIVSSSVTRSISAGAISATVGGFVITAVSAVCSSFLTPYIQATDAELYAFVSARTLAQGMASAEELPGFHFN